MHDAQIIWHGLNQLQAPNRIQTLRSATKILMY